MKTQRFGVEFDLRDDAAISQLAATILLVDDDELVRSGVAGLLDAMGYTVIEAASAPDALDCLAGNPQIDLLLTDHLMPGMSGFELVREVQRAYPHIPAIMMSGLTSLTGSSPVPDNSVVRLEKPFRFEHLRQAIAEVLGPPSGA